MPTEIPASTQFELCPCATEVLVKFYNPSAISGAQEGARRCVADARRDIPILDMQSHSIAKWRSGSRHREGAKEKYEEADKDKGPNDALAASLVCDPIVFLPVQISSSFYVSTTTAPP